MNSLTHTTSRVFSSRQSNQYTPGLHGRPSTILIGARESEPVVSGRTSMSKLFPLLGLSPLRSVLSVCLLVDSKIRVLEFRGVISC